MALDDGSNSNFQPSWPGSFKKLIGATPMFTGAGSADPVPYTWSETPATYNTWQPAPAPATPSYSGGSGGGYVGGDYGGGGGGTGNVAVAAPPSPPPPDYSKMGNDELSALDSTFMDQKSMLADALSKYIADYERQGKRLGEDRDFAIKGIGRNREQGTKNIAEDFAARGLGKSGLWDQARTDANTAFDRQENATNKSFADQNSTLDFNKGKFERDNTANLASARRDAIARLTQAQGLI